MNNTTNNTLTLCKELKMEKKYLRKLVESMVYIKLTAKKLERTELCLDDLIGRKQQLLQLKNMKKLKQEKILQYSKIKRPL